MTNFDLEEELKPNLSSGEKLIWTGKPKTGILLRSSDIFMIPFSLVWCGFVLVWETSVITTNVITTGAPFFFKLLGIPFVLVGLYITIGRFFVDAKKRANTIYGITEDRIIIKSGIFSRDVNSLNIKNLSDITLNQKADNSGTITLGPTGFSYSMMQGVERPMVKQPPRFEYIEDVKTVYNKIIDLQRQK